MLAGLPPFYDGEHNHATIKKKSTEGSPEETDKMYGKILNDPLVFGEEFGDEARSILTGLLTRDPTHRLGVHGAEEIKRHPFFDKHIDFKILLEKKIQPPFKPSVASPVVCPLQTYNELVSFVFMKDVSNFDTVFTTEDPIDSVVEDSNLSQTVQAQFSGIFSCCLFCHAMTNSRQGFSFNGTHLPS